MEKMITVVEFPHFLNQVGRCMQEDLTQEQKTRLTALVEILKISCKLVRK